MVMWLDWKENGIQDLKCFICSKTNAGFGTSFTLVSCKKTSRCQQSERPHASYSCFKLIQLHLPEQSQDIKPVEEIYRLQGDLVYPKTTTCKSPRLDKRDHSVPRHRKTDWSWGGGGKGNVILIHFKIKNWLEREHKRSL